MIDPVELHDWLIDAIAEQPFGVPDEGVRRVAHGVAAAYLVLGRHFEVFTDDEDQHIRAMLENTRH